MRAADLQMWCIQVTVFIWNKSVLLTSKNIGTFMGEIFASENQNAARQNGETELVSQDIIILKTVGIIKSIHFF